MRTFFHPQRALLALLLIFTLLAGVAPQPGYAQEPVPPTAVPPPPPPEETPDGYIAPSSLANLSDADLAALNFPTEIQGVVKLTVLVSPARFRSPQDLTYTYIYTNTSASQAATGIQLSATWSKWRLNSATNTNPDTVWQYCADNACNVEVGSTQGPAVTKSADITSGVRYGIGDLAPNQSGRFQVKLRVPNNVYPVNSLFSAVPLRTPAGSAQLFINSNTNQVISEASAAALVEGPVFRINKVITGQNTKIYPLDLAEFRITLTNENRQDAIPATNIVLTDVLPGGSEYVDSSGAPSPEQIQVNNKPALRWNLPGPLNPGQSIQIVVRFRKLDSNPCTSITNSGTLLSVTSAEMPLKTGSTTDRFTVVSKDNPKYTVQEPLKITSISASPGTVPFGDVAELTITVRNYWSGPVNNARLTYSIQGNAFYRSGTATGSGTDQLIAAPDGNTPGGQIIWKLDMPAGSIATPSVKTFSLGLRAGTTLAGTGTALITDLASSGVPGGCVLGKTGDLNLTERIRVVKYTDAEEVNGKYYAREGDSFPYVIEITNVGVDPVNTVAVIDELPSTTNANFLYEGGATLDDIAFEPYSFLNGLDGRIEWRNITVAPGQTRLLRYNLTVGGSEFLNYCNGMNKSEMSETTGEPVAATGRVCVKINPNIKLTKTLVDQSQATIQGPLPTGGVQVKFRLELTNNESQSYKMALYDLLPNSFAFESVESSNTQAPIVNDANDVEWPIVTVAPGSTLNAVIVTRFNPPCAKETYVNELRYRFVDNTNETLRIASVPPTTAKIQYLCGTNRLEYSSSVGSIKEASLGDKVTYTLTVKNRNTVNPLTNVSVVNILPPGFSFVGMSNGAGNPTSSVRPDQRVQLTWTIPSIAANGQSQIIFVARTSNVIGVYRNWMYATAADLLEAVCTGTCEAITSGSDARTYAAPPLTLRPLHTFTPVVEPSDSCANVGDRVSYRLTMINTNIHAYESTVVSLTLPLGLHYAGVTDGTPSPTVTPAPDAPGSTLLVWKGITVPKKPTSEYAGIYTLSILLDVGQVWSNQPTVATADSPDGLIPRTDGEIDPAIQICAPAQPAIAKDVSQGVAETDDEFYYQIEVANPTSEVVTLTVEDQLPSNVSYVTKASGPNPSVAGNKLTWTDLQVPAADGDGKPGVARLLFKVRFVSGESGVVFANRATVLSSSVPIDTTHSEVGVEVRKDRFVYLPVVLR